MNNSMKPNFILNHIPEKREALYERLFEVAEFKGTNTYTARTIAIGFILVLDVLCNRKGS